MKMPALFVGHGSPMNAVEDNDYTREWQRIGKAYKPKAILMISAHWYTDGQKTQDDKHPRKIDDMYGFPRDLYDLEYPALGDKALTEDIIASLPESVVVDNTWGGLDHGTWSVLIHMYPEADVPVVQLSVDYTKKPEEQFEVGRAIGHLRDKGYMIIGSGNVVHNLRMINPSLDGPDPRAASFDDYIEAAIRSGDFDQCVHYLDFGDAAKYSVPTPDHYYPLLNILGAASTGNKSADNSAKINVEVFNKSYDMGSLSMTGYLFKD